MAVVVVVHVGYVVGALQPFVGYEMITFVIIILINIKQTNQSNA